MLNYISKQNLIKVVNEVQEICILTDHGRTLTEASVPHVLSFMALIYHSWHFCSCLADTMILFFGQAGQGVRVPLEPGGVASRTTGRPISNLPAAWKSLRLHPTTDCSSVSTSPTHPGEVRPTEEENQHQAAAASGWLRWSPVVQPCSLWRAVVEHPPTDRQDKQRCQG